MVHVCELLLHTPLIIIQKFIDVSLCENEK